MNLVISILFFKMAHKNHLLEKSTWKWLIFLCPSRGAFEILLYHSDVYVSLKVKYSKTHNKISQQIGLSYELLWEQQAWD